MSSDRNGVLVVDDHAMFAEALAAALEKTGRFDPVLWARSAAQALEIAREAHPALAIADLRMPDVEHCEFIEDLCGLDDPPAVLVLSVAADSRSIVGAFEAGAHGFIGKHESFDAVIAAAESVLAGEYPISSSAFARVLPRLLRSDSTLTDREGRILALLTESRSNEEIAETLGVSYYTVRNHVSSILRKLEVSNRAQAVEVGRSLGLIPPLEEV